MKHKSLLIVGHTRSGGHFLMNAISMNFPYYTHHRQGKDLFRKKCINETDRIIREFQPTNEIQITRQQAWSFRHCKNALKEKFIIIYILRDGRDVVDSLFDMHTKIYRWSKAQNLNEFMNKSFMKNSYEARVNLIKAENPIDSWLLHLKSWLFFFRHEDKKTNWQWPDNFIFYEDLCRDYTYVVKKKIAKILNMEPGQTISIPAKDFNCISPRRGCPDQWKKNFTKEDEKFFWDYVIKHQCL